MYHHKMDIRALDDMIPWEKEMLVHLIAKDIEEENLKRTLEAQHRKATGGSR